MRAAGMFVQGLADSGLLGKVARLQVELFGSLGATGMGLGGCWAGYFNAAVNTFPPMQQALGLPEGHQCYGAMMIGYPKFRYHRMPERKAPSITWR